METCGRAPENIRTIIGPSPLRTVWPTRPEPRLEPVTTYARLRPSRVRWEDRSSMHPGASTMNVSPSWRVSRGRSVLDVPLIARPTDRYESEDDARPSGLRFRTRAAIPTR